MPRIARCWQWTQAACYHLMDRGHNRQDIFSDDQDRAAFLGLVARYCQQFGFRLYHYCLMSNHFHLLLQLRRPGHLSPLMAGLLRAYIHHVHRRHGFVGHLFQGRFKSPAIEADSYALSCGRYIERNPVEAGLVGLPWDHAWSSCRAYALGKVDPLLADNPWYEQLARDAQRRCELWQELVLGEDSREAEVRRADWAIGTEAFRGWMAQARGRPLRRRGRPRKVTAGNTLLDPAPALR
jgi:putative transposase